MTLLLSYDGGSLCLLWWTSSLPLTMEVLSYSYACGCRSPDDYHEPGVCRALQHNAPGGPPLGWDRQGCGHTEDHWPSSSGWGSSPWTTSIAMPGFIQVTMHNKCMLGPSVYCASIAQDLSTSYQSLYNKIPSYPECNSQSRPLLGCFCKHFVF